MGETPKDHVFLFCFTLLINLFFVTFYKCALNQQGPWAFKKGSYPAGIRAFLPPCLLHNLPLGLKFSEQHFFFFQTIMVIRQEAAQSWARSQRNLSWTISILFWLSIFPVVCSRTSTHFFGLLVFFCAFNKLLNIMQRTWGCMVFIVKILLGIPSFSKA